MTELDELKHDIAEYVKVSSEMASEIVSQQAEIERLKGQRDRLTERLKESQSAVKLCLDTFMYTENVRMADKYHQMWTINSGLIAEIEAEK